MTLRCIAVAYAALLLVGCAGSQSFVTQKPEGALSLRSVRGAAASYQTFFDFDHKDGNQPNGGLVAHDGKLYGSANGGQIASCRQTSGCGVIFSITPGGAEKVLYTFAGHANGSFPSGPMTYLKGKLYGTTVNGGTSSCFYHCGMIYSFSIGDSTLTELHHFSGGDGKKPYTGLVLMNGNLYGTTNEGGVRSHCREGCGTVYSISPSGTFKTLYRFKSANGPKYPGVLVALNGTLYGVLQRGGVFNTACAYGCGGIFSITAAGTEHMIYEFTGNPDGQFPGALIANGNSLEGTTLAGGTYNRGTVFTLTTSGTESVLYSFGSGQYDGGNPNNLTLLNGVLYGTTGGGGQYDDGTLYTLTSSGVENIIHDFTGKPDGGYPDGGLTALGGVYYGATYEGGTKGLGSLYSLTP